MSENEQLDNSGEGSIQGNEKIIEASNRKTMFEEILAVN